MRRRVRVYEWLSEALEGAGVLVTAYGVGRIYAPLGWIVGGLFLALVGFSLSPKPGERP
jgi:hypothetical protein